MVIEEDWLIRIFQNRNLEDLQMNVLSREQTCFRLLFADAVGKKQDGTEETIHCFLKYHMSVVAFVDEDPRAKEYFSSERYWYDVIYPTFLEFQQEKNVDTPFDNAPECYGTLLDDISQVLFQRVIVLENVRATGHKTWPNTHALSRRQLEMVLEAYAKLHATSVAMHKHEPLKFNNIIDIVTQLEQQRKDVMGDKEKLAAYEPGLKKLFQFLEVNRDVQLPEEERQEKNDEFVAQGAAVFAAKKEAPLLRVILHGDCWTNNFMSKFEDEKALTGPTDLVIVDWQMIQFGSPICDLSSFLFSYISEQDIQHLDTLLNFYYNHFCAHLMKMDMPDTDAVYPYHQFMDEWKMLCKYGFIVTFHSIVGISEGEAASSDVAVDMGILMGKLKHVVDYLKEHNLMQV